MSTPASVLPPLVADFVRHLGTKKNHIETFAKHRDNGAREIWFGGEFLQTAEISKVEVEEEHWIGRRKFDFLVDRSELVELKQYTLFADKYIDSTCWRPKRNNIPDDIRRLQSVKGIKGINKGWSLTVAFPVAKGEWTKRSSVHLQKYFGVSQTGFYEIPLSAGCCSIALYNVF